MLQNVPECTILRQFPKNFPGETPRTPTCGRGWPPPSPFRRFRPQWSLRLQTLVLQQFTIVLQRKKSWTPLFIIMIYVKKAWLLQRFNVWFNRDKCIIVLWSAGEVRNDLYVTLSEGEFEKDGKKSQKNIEVSVSVFDHDGKPIKVRIYVSFALYPMYVHIVSIFFEFYKAIVKNLSCFHKWLSRPFS